MTRRKAEAVGAVIAGLVAVHEHSRTLKQERRLANRPNFGDRFPAGLLALILAGLCVYAAVLLVAAVWPWLLGAAIIVLGWRVLRRRRMRSERPS
jgi:fatty acid desaturase